MKRSWYAAPYALWMVMFTVVPLLFVCYFAFTTKSGDFTTANITKIFQYTPVLMDSLRLACLENNETGHRFWEAMGFRDLRKGETLTGQNSAVWVMERLSAPDGDESSSEERAV